MVDDEHDIASLVAVNLRQSGYESVDAASAEEALKIIQHQKIDLLVLDLLLPRMSGFELCAHLKSKPATAGIPIIVISALNAESDRLRALNMGAEDYLAKPFSVRELVARVRAVLRRVNGHLENETMVCGDLHFDLLRDRLIIHGQPVSLSRNEFRLLKYLAANAGHVFTRDELLDFLWGRGSKLGSGNIDVHIHRLRRKLETDPGRPVYLHTVWGVGYRFGAAENDE